ncbi:MAG: GIY-YIG nuclease family protein, partial [Deltaproteobacteria bacterium]|nr:GIY-YIG nuclease family protein [Deltaproteobacteria bacterium]
MPYYVYLLKSLKTGTSYVGHTNDLSRRIVEHN